MVGADAWYARLVFLTGLMGSEPDLYHTYLGNEGHLAGSTVDRIKQFADAHGITPLEVRDYIMANP